MESYLDRKERLKGEGKVELPLNVDMQRYFIFNITFKDLAIISPVLVLSIILIVIFKQTGNLSQGTVIVSIAPTFFIIMLQLIKHPIRKNLSFLTFRMIWRFQFNKREKQFIYQKGEIDMENEQDVRKQLGIKNIFSGTYETTDNHFVKVLEVSSINLSLMNDKEQDSVFDGFRTFLNETGMKKFQISEIAQPVNLTQYLLYVDRKTENEKNYAKRMLKHSYKNYVGNIQKSRNMVQRKRYIVIRGAISSNREKSLEEVEQLTRLITSKVENMLSGSTTLHANALMNDELTKLMYTCLDYDNAQALGDAIVGRANNTVNITMGEKTAKEVLDEFEKKLEESIN